MSSTITTRTILLSGLLGLVYASPAAAVDPMEGLDKGKVTIDLRYRYETVDQDPFTRDAKASTIRGRFGAITGYYYYLRAGVEVEAVGDIGPEDFNNTINGRGQFPVVADVESAEINQAYFEFIGLPDTVIKGGRAVQTLDNHRFLGHVGWRQNMQSFDGVFVTNKSLPQTEAFYGYIGNVNRIFGNDSRQGDFEGENHAVRIKNSSLPIGTVAGYAYLFDNFNKLRRSTALSSQTYGGFLKGKHKVNNDVTLGWYFEYANQSDYADNFINYEADYYHVAPWFSWKGIKTTIGYEVLGSDNGIFGFSTPYATLHKFNGWADKFLATPRNGLEDFYVDVTYKVKGMTGVLSHFNGTLLKAQYHDYESDVGDVDLGSEWGFYSKSPLGKGFYMESKYAFYEEGDVANGSPRDTQKYIFGLGFKY